MKYNCPNPQCKRDLVFSPDLSLIVQKGFFFRKSDSRWIQRFRCKICGADFSAATHSKTYRQKARRMTPFLEGLICSGVSQRRAAKLLGVNRKTVIRRIRFIAVRAREKEARYLKLLETKPISSIQFDDLETSEHTKCKPLSVALAIEPNSRKILGFQVNQMPAKGRLSHISRRKYGYRRDERAKGWNELLKSLKPILTPNVQITSDENPHYPKFIKRHYPKCSHKTILGGRGAITGQGELKKKRFDPIFSLNHTCAMLRANLNRLFRKTWCTTKTRQGLIDHLSIYMAYHNRELTRLCPLKGAS